jgi:hypothetical protein
MRPQVRSIGRLTLVAALVASAVAMAVWLMREGAPDEPVYKGQALREWLREFDHPQDNTNYLAAREAILQMGTNVLPHLERYLRYEDWRYHRQWIRLKARLGILRGPVDYQSDWRKRAAKACGQFGEAGAPAFPAMMEAAHTRGAEDDVTRSLSWMLPKSAPVLTNLLSSPNPNTRYRAADALATAPSHPPVEVMARTALLNALRDRDKGLRVSAADALGVLGTSTRLSREYLDAVIPALTEALSDPHPSVRGNAATSLGNFGTNARMAVPQLLKLLQDTDRYPRERSAQMLRKIDPEAAAKAGVTQ